MYSDSSLGCLLFERGEGGKGIINFVWSQKPRPRGWGQPAAGAVVPSQNRLL